MNTSLKFLFVVFLTLSSCGLFLDKHKFAEELSGLEIPANAIISNFENYEEGIVFISVEVALPEFELLMNQLSEFELLPPDNNLETFIPAVNESLKNQGIYKIKKSKIDPSEFTLIILDETDQKLIIYHSVS
ncbi:MAG: hypothetical protein ACMZ7B_04240 [Balneola sp.]